MEACEARDTRALEAARDEMAVLHAEAAAVAVEAGTHAGGVRDHDLRRKVVHRPTYQRLKVVANPLTLGLGFEMGLGLGSL